MKERTMERIEVKEKN